MKLIGHLTAIKAVLTSCPFIFSEQDWNINDGH